jgi:hypothetical protein
MNRIERFRDHATRGELSPPQQETDMTQELNIAELDRVNGGDLKEVHFNPGYKEPTVKYDDGINVQTSGLFHSNVVYTLT